MPMFKTTARPYAKAAFEYACGNGMLDAWQEFLINAALITDDDQIQLLIDHPSRKKRLVLDLFFSVLEEKEPLSRAFKNFLILLISYDRITALNEIKDQFLQMRFDLEKMADARVVSAYEFTDEQKRRLMEKLEKRFDKKIQLTYQVDETLLGGAIVCVGDLVIDGSGRNQWQQMKEYLN